MVISTVLKTLLVLQCCVWCLTIKVPVKWNNEGSYDQIKNDSVFDNSAVRHRLSNEEQSEDLIKTRVTSKEPDKWNADSESSVTNYPIPVEYFEYTHTKPQFAIDVAAFHNVNSPEKLYRATPIKPFNEYKNQILGKHVMKGKSEMLLDPLHYTQNQNVYSTNTSPIISNYEIFHPYKSEVPALEELYKDPTLSKIRNDIRNNKIRLQNYENEAGKPNVSQEDYLKTPEDIDNEKFPSPYKPTDYEIHKPQRKPVYYTLPRKVNRYNYLNRRFKHPLNQNYIKIRPSNYYPLHSYLGKLKQHHAQKYDDEYNEYPQIRQNEHASTVPDGYDIYEKGKENFLKLRDNVDNSINHAIIENRPESNKYLEMQNTDESNGDTSDRNIDEEEEFVPIKSYAQVRKTETTKHVPRLAALDEATSYEEIKNAPRLREAVKSTKAQTVYTEEGYEDSAYDHAGEQKHASDHEGHGGYLNQKEISGGKFKAPSVTGNHEDGHTSEYGDKIVHGEKYTNYEKDTDKQAEIADSNADEYDELTSDDVYQELTGEANNKSKVNVSAQHGLNKREANFTVPEININDTYLTEDEILNISKQQLLHKGDHFGNKYPYYDKHIGNLDKNSPLRYAENLKFIPKKSKGGSEFYESRASLICPEVDEDIDPIPKNVKDAEQKNDTEHANVNERRKKRQADFDQIEEKPRLKGLGDKIDCFKAKYFGENPLDSPFFKEGIIFNPEPIVIPQIPTYKLKTSLINDQETKSNNVYSIAEKLREDNKRDIYDLIEKIKNGRFDIQHKFKTPSNSTIASANPLLHNVANDTSHFTQSNVYTDILLNIKNNNSQVMNLNNVEKHLLDLQSQNVTNDTTKNYDSFDNKEDVTKLPSTLRKKRSTSFIYEPYKVIRDNHANESKKTTTLTNVSPLIKQLQSSRVVDTIPTSLEDKKKKDKLQPVKRNVGLKNYKDIKEVRQKNNKMSEPGFVNINTDKRKREPRYEIIRSNHKTEYTPVQTRKSMSVDDFKHLSNKENTEEDNKENDDDDEDEEDEDDEKEKEYNQKQRKSIPIRQQTAKPYFDVSQYIPKTITPPPRYYKLERKVETTTPSTNDSTDEDDESDTEEYDEDDDVTTTTIKTPVHPRRNKNLHPTQKTPQKRGSHDDDTEDIDGDDDDESEETQFSQRPKLQMVTRFRYPKNEKIETKNNPKYTEKSKKSSKSTLITDSKVYGEGNDDMKKDEVDAMIHVHQNMNDYVPEYERNGSAENENENSDESLEQANSSSNEDEVEYENDDEEFDSNERKIDVSQNENKKEYENRNNDRDDNNKLKRSSDKRKDQEPIEPIVHKKKIEIHKELPMNRSTSHMTKFKQDIVEEEIVTELPMKNLEALELYKDGDLPENVNKLADVDVFRQDLDVMNSPRHGGNYRSIKNDEIENSKKSNNIKLQDNSQTKEGTSQNISTKPQHRNDSEVKSSNAQIENFKRIRGNSRGKMKHVEVIDGIKGATSAKPTRVAVGRHDKQRENAKLVAAKRNNDNPDIQSKQGEQSKTVNEVKSIRRRRIQSSNENSKPEIDETHEDINKKAMHGGNLKSLAESERIIDGRHKAADLLNSFAQAVPILTTTPVYILDPSKRMYYYVDA